MRPKRLRRRCPQMGCCTAGPGCIASPPQMDLSKDMAWGQGRQHLHDQEPSRAAQIRYGTVCLHPFPKQTQFNRPIISCLPLIRGKHRIHVATVAIWWRRGVGHSDSQTGGLSCSQCALASSLVGTRPGDEAYPLNLGMMHATWACHLSLDTRVSLARSRPGIGFPSGAPYTRESLHVPTLPFGCSVSPPPLWGWSVAAPAGMPGKAMEVVGKVCRCSMKDSNSG